MNEHKNKYIFSMNLAGYLMQRKHKLLRINHNLKYEGYDVYVFRDTEELRRDMEKYNSKVNQISETDVSGIF